MGRALIRCRNVSLHSLRGTTMRIIRYIGILSLSIVGNVAVAQVADFPVWLEALRVEAIESGISAATVDAALADVAPVRTHH